MESTRINGFEVYNKANAFSGQYDDYFRMDLRIGIKSIERRSTQEWAFDFQNVTNNDNPLSIKYNPITKNQYTQNHLGFQWNILWRINF